MPRRQLDFHDFGSVATEIDRLQDSGYSPVGTWDLFQTCDHLAKTMRSSLDGFPKNGPWYFRYLLAPMIKGRFFKKRRMPEGFRAPAALIPPVSGDDKLKVQLCMVLMVRMGVATVCQLSPS